MSPDNAQPDRPRPLRPEGEGKTVVPPPAGRLSGRLSDSEHQGDHVLSAEGLAERIQELQERIRQVRTIAENLIRQARDQ